MKIEEVGAFEAKTHLSALLERVQRGAAFYITKRGKRVALLKACVEGEARRMSPEDILRRLRAIRRGSKTGPGSLKQLVEAGRRI